MLSLNYMGIVFTFLLFSSASQQLGTGLARMAPPSRPLFRIPLSKLENIPTLEQLSYKLAVGVRKQLYTYSSQYSEILTRHLSNETKVQIVGGCVTEDSIPKLSKLESEMAVLQFRPNLRRILRRPWVD